MEFMAAISSARSGGRGFGAREVWSGREDMERNVVLECLDSAGRLRFPPVWKFPHLVGAWSCVYYGVAGLWRFR